MGSARVGKRIVFFLLKVQATAVIRIDSATSMYIIDRLVVARSSVLVTANPFSRLLRCKTRRPMG